MEMMLKNLLGIDPNELKEQFAKGMQTLGETLHHFDARLVAIESQLKELNKQLGKDQDNAKAENANE